MAVADQHARDALATQDAAVLRLAVVRTLELTTLPAASRRIATELLERLRDVGDEWALDAALTTLPTLTSSVAEWATTDEVRAAHATLPSADDPPHSWHDRRIVRFAAVISVLRALEEGPESHRGRELAATALALAAEARAVPVPGRRPAHRDAPSWAASAPVRRRRRP